MKSDLVWIRDGWWPCICRGGRIEETVVISLLTVVFDTATDRDDAEADAYCRRAFGRDLRSIGECMFCYGGGWRLVLADVISRVERGEGGGRWSMDS